MEVNEGLWGERAGAQEGGFEGVGGEALFAAVLEVEGLESEGLLKDELAQERDEAVELVVEEEAEGPGVEVADAEEG